MIGIKYGALRSMMRTNENKHIPKPTWDKHGLRGFWKPDQSQIIGVSEWVNYLVYWTALYKANSFFHAQIFLYTSHILQC